MVDTWTYPIETKPQGNTTKPTKRAQFGDNYRQQAGYGLNAENTTWTVVVDNTETVVGQARTFLQTQGGYLPFYWTPPGRSSPELFTCDTWSETPNLANQNRLTATFERYYLP